MKVVVVGYSGQLASELAKTCPIDIELVPLGRPQLDLTASHSDIHKAIAPHRPDVVINASAYAAVDKAESEPEQAHAVNEHGVRTLAEACKILGARLLHVSTDFVFGPESALTTKGIAPLLPDAPAHPMNVYGASKLAGEHNILSILPHQSIIVRTAWLYSAYGNNFVKTMLKLMKSRTELGVIADQVGTPTWARGLAEWLWEVARRDQVNGVYHWTDAGVASWYDFAVAIQGLALEKRLLDKAIPIKAIPTESFPTPATRPGYSVLDKRSAEQVSGMPAKHWREQLSLMLDELKDT